MQRHLLFFFITLLFFSTDSYGLPLSSLAPKDKTTTYSQFMTLKGAGKNLLYAKVNNVSLDVTPDSFGCGLVLNPGKNFVKVEVWDNAGNYKTYTRRILRLVSFPDVEKLYNNRPHWARHLIVTLSTLGIIEGHPDNNYYVDKSLTRGELATWIVRAQGFKVFPSIQDAAVDVPKEHWRASYIKEVIDRGYMKTDDKGNFGVDLSVPRAEAAATAIVAEGESFQKEILSVFYDVPKTNPFYEQIKLAKAKGLIKGISWKTAIYEPRRDITRAEAAVLMSRFGRVQWMNKWLYDFNVGYQNNPCKINTSPKIKDAQITPATIILGETPIMNLRTIVEDQEGLENILNVKADISSLGGPADAKMHDDGAEGDPAKNDGEYALQFTGSSESTGEKNINVTVTDKLGWQGAYRVNVLVVK